MDGCKAGATEAAPGHPKRGSKFHSTLMRDDFFVRIIPSAFVRDSSLTSNGDAYPQHCRWNSLGMTRWLKLPPYWSNFIHKGAIRAALNVRPLWLLVQIRNIPRRRQRTLP